MRIFISSILIGFLGIIVGGAIGVSDFWMIAFGLIGFSFPYAITLDKIYQMLIKANESSALYKHEEDKSYDISKVPVDKCPACFTEVSTIDHNCPSCGLKLIEE